MEPIQPNSMVLSISEYGKEVRKYNDVDYERFIRTAETIILEHLRKARQNSFPDQVKKYSNTPIYPII